MTYYQRARVDIQLKALKFDKMNRCNTAANNTNAFNSRKYLPKMNPLENREISDIKEVTPTQEDLQEAV
jgi:hypothetical protein